MSIPTTYRGSITREQWLVNETRVVARLMADEDLSDSKEIIEKSGIKTKIPGRIGLSSKFPCSMRQTKEE